MVDDKSILIGIGSLCSLTLDAQEGNAIYSAKYSAVVKMILFEISVISIRVSHFECKYRCIRMLLLQFFAQSMALPS